MRRGTDSMLALAIGEQVAGIHRAVATAARRAYGQVG